MAAMLTTILTHLLLLHAANAYFVGDHVDTIIYTTSDSSLFTTDRIEATVAQRPKFGIDSTVHIARTSANSNPNSFSLGFEEGYHQLSWVDGSTVKTLRVTLRYSKSGQGHIHSVSSQPILWDTSSSSSSSSKTTASMDAQRNRQRERTSTIEIQYIWIEQETVDIQSGAILMFLVTFVVSVFFFLQACALPEDKNGETTTSTSSSSAYSASTSTTRWDYHHE